jgi:hypothetical protein
MEATVRKSSEKLNYCQWYFVDTVMREKVIDNKFTIRAFKGRDRYGEPCLGIDIVFKNKAVSAVAILSKNKEKEINNIFETIKNFDGVYRFVSLFQI